MTSGILRRLIAKILAHNLAYAEAAAEVALVALTAVAARNVVDADEAFNHCERLPG